MIVPTYNRAIPLADTLADLIAQDYPTEKLELVVVDNSSSDNTEEVVSACRRHARFPVSFYRKENRGPAASRNLAIRRSSGEILAFTDSDCRLASDWVRRGVQHMTGNVGLVAGPVRPRNNPDRIPGFFHHQIDHAREDAIFATANVFYRRDIVERLGGFNESYGTFPFGLPVGGEDTDLAWRVKRAGYESVFTADTAVYHEATDMRPIAWFLEPFRSQIVPKLVREFPDMRESLWARYFLSREHALFYPLIAGVAASAITRRWLPLLFAAPWFWDLRSMVARDAHVSRWWRIPIKYGLTSVRHVVFTATAIYASIRYRTLVL